MSWELTLVDIRRPMLASTSGHRCHWRHLEGGVDSAMRPASQVLEEVGIGWPRLVTMAQRGSQLIASPCKFQALIGRCAQRGTTIIADQLSVTVRSRLFALLYTLSAVSRGPKQGNARRIPYSARLYCALRAVVGCEFEYL